MIIFKRTTILIAASAFIFCTTNLNAKNIYTQFYEDLPFSMEKINAPVFKNNTVSIVEFGGVGDGKALNTSAFSKAIDALSNKGGGKLVVPAGVWFTGPIVFKSNINLHLDKGALILFSSNFDLYPLVNTIFEGLETRRCQSPISGRNLENVAITGQGSINGSGEAWRPLKRSKVTDAQWKKVVKSGGVLKDQDNWYPTAKSIKGQSISDMNVPRGNISETDWLEIKDFLRPVMISFIECKNVFLQGVLFENSPSWNIHPLMCTNVIVDNIFARNPSYSQNGDGIDVESCKNVLIVNSTFDVGDDAICIKSGKDVEGRLRARPTENVIVDNCKVFQGHGGFVVGSEMSGGVRNISVRNCQFMGTDVGLRFKSNRGRGGVVENIYISDIYMFNIVTDSFLFDLYYGGKSASESQEDGDVNPKEITIPQVTAGTPSFRNIYVKNIVSRNANRAMFFNGLPEMNISNINVENAFITSQYGVFLSESDGVKFKNVHVTPQTGAALTLQNVKNFELNDFTYPDSLIQVVKTEGKSTNIQLPNSIDKQKIIWIK
ncbi:MAG TPA: glycoside hydrolase family 28 protein [Paludibacter sp.]|nr:glycoside hydrolase family 28 protein [Paludibacter sp.]